jgi:thioredoxin-like negative regulator of GroEL
VVASHFGGWERPWLALDAEAWGELATEFGARVERVTIETHANREFALCHGLEILPEVLLFLRGEVVARFSGRVAVAELRTAIHEALRTAQSLAEATTELEASTRAREGLSPVRSVLRNRTTPLAADGLAQVG